MNPRRRRSNRQRRKWIVLRYQHAGLLHVCFYRKGKTNPIGYVTSKTPSTPGVRGSGVTTTIPRMRKPFRTDVTEL